MFEPVEINVDGSHDTLLGQLAHQHDIYDRGREILFLFFQFSQVVSLDDTPHNYTSLRVDCVVPVLHQNRFLD